jgi:hypothetical protein
MGSFDVSTITARHFPVNGGRKIVSSHLVRRLPPVTDAYNQENPEKNFTHRKFRELVTRNERKNDKEEGTYNFHSP